jgi:hypothetical protein
LEEALGIEAFPEHFSAGWSQPCFDILEGAGFEIVPKDGLGETSGNTGAPSAQGYAPATEDDATWMEGNPRVVRHLRRERAPGLAAKKRAAFIAAHGHLFCERCKLDPVQAYGGQFGEGCIEVHHTVPVAKMPEGYQTALADLQCLCANCHRVTHRELAVTPNWIDYP